MPIPADILNVVRPKNTRIKKNGNRYDVIKRTCKYVNGKRIPVELGKIGEIIDGKFVEKVTKKLGMSNADIKDYGKVQLCHNLSTSLFEELCCTFEISDAQKIYSIALLRAAYGNVCDRDLKFRYETSFLSEICPSLALSESTVCRFLEILGRNVNTLMNFMKNRLKNIDNDSLAIIDGMLKDCTCSTSSYCNWSRKSRIKGTQDISLLYAFNSTSGEPIAHKIYPGNMLDSTSFSDFISHFDFKDCIIMGDKGFLTPSNIKSLGEDIGYIFPLKRSNSDIIKNELYKYNSTFKFEDDVIEYCKKEIDGKFYYSFKSLIDEAQERKGYIINADKKDSYDKEKLDKKSIKFGTIVFISNKNFSPIDVYTMYDKRWEIETYFNFYKNIASLNNVRVQNDVSIIGSEFINFISSIISVRVKKYFLEKELNKEYSYTQIMNYLDQLKKYYDVSTGKWCDTKTVAYIRDIGIKLELINV